jgi:hypothetical protein
MLFHVRKSVSTGFVETPEGGKAAAPVKQYEFSPERVLFAMLALLLVGGLMLGCWGLGYAEGATAMLHLFEVMAGGLAGLLFGERMGMAGEG